MKASKCPKCCNHSLGIIQKRLPWFPLPLNVLFCNVCQSEFGVLQYLQIRNAILDIDNFSVNYKLHLPIDALKGLIQAYFITEFEDDLETDFNATILPSETPMITINYGRGNVKGIDDGIKLPNESIRGPYTKNVKLVYNKKVCNFGIIFKPNGWSLISGFRATLFTNKEYSLNNLGEDFKKFGEEIIDAKNNSDRVNISNRFFYHKLLKNESKGFNNSIFSFTDLIIKSKGNINLVDEYNKLPYSISKIERNFKNVIGISPKQFSKIVRFNNLICSFPNYDLFKQRAYNLGFYDQAHFIKEFKLFTGITPKVFFTSTKALEKYWKQKIN